MRPHEIHQRPHPRPLLDTIHCFFGAPDAFSREHVARELSVHKRPREIRFVDALPRNAMGKIVKPRLADS